MMEFFNFLLSIFSDLVILFMVLLCVAFFSLMERKILSYVHFRKGPNKVLLNGFFQPIVDAVKLLSKDDFPVNWSNKFFFYLSPMFMFFLALVVWMIFPLTWGKMSNEYSFINMIIVFGLSVYGIMLSGWASNSTYSMLGSIRSVSQSISYEVVMSFIILSLIYLNHTFSLEGFYKWKLTKISLMCPFLLVLGIITLLAELNRTPFDLSEGESELVSGYSVEYGGWSYTIVFLGENIMIFFSSFFISFFFFTHLLSYASYFYFSITAFLFCLIRGILPRIRYDNLMLLCWVLFTPSTLLIFNFVVLLAF